MHLQILIYSRLPQSAFDSFFVIMTEKVQTVLGPICPEQLGVTFCHEHLSMDFQEAAFTAPAAKDVSKVNCSFTLGNVGWIRQVVLPYLIDTFLGRVAMN